MKKSPLAKRRAKCTIRGGSAVKLEGSIRSGRSIRTGSLFAAAAALASPNTASALSPDHFDPAVEHKTVDALITGTLSQSLAGSGRLGLTENAITAPIANAFRRLFPEYRLSDQPLCAEPADADAQFRFNRVKYVYSGAADSADVDERGGLPRILELAVSPIGAANAFIFPAIHDHEVEEEAPRIVLTHGLLNELSTEGEIAFVLGHEIGHLKAGSLPGSMAGFVVSPEQQEKISRTRQQWELDADRFAAELLYSRGYAAETVQSALATLAHRESGAAAGSHPKIKERLENLGFSIPPALEPHQNEAPHRTAAAAVPLSSAALAR